MGGDGAPDVPVAAALEAVAARPDALRVMLVGERRAVEAALARCGGVGTPGVAVCDAEGILPEGGHPATLMRRLPRNSIRQAARLVAAGDADAAVSMGHTGACLVAATWEMGLLPGVERPAAAVTFGFAPDMTFLDAGPNPDPTPDQMVQFARLGLAYAATVFGIPTPRVALLSNGREPGKGNRLAQAAFRRLEASGLPFIGNVEGLDLVHRPADVVVTDGFTGNAVLKAVEGVAGHLAGLLTGVAGGGGDLARAAAEIARVADTTQTGAPIAFLGVDGLFVPGHGRSDAAAIARTLWRTAEMVRSGFVDRLRSGLAPAPCGEEAAP
jgi:glycerol-3-phosphate acyltransferase PlsX